MAEETVIAHPKPGRTIYLAGGVHGFTEPVELPKAQFDVYKDAGHVMTAEEKAAAERVSAAMPAKVDSGDKKAAPAS